MVHDEMREREEPLQRGLTGKFRDRGELMKTLKFPENNHNLVVVPSNEKGTGFLRTCYDSDILAGILTKD